MERPVGNDSHPLNVSFTLSLIQIMDVVSSRSHLKLRQSLLKWTHPEPFDYDSVFLGEHRALACLQLKWKLAGLFMPETVTLIMRPISFKYLVIYLWMSVIF